MSSLLNKLKGGDKHHSSHHHDQSGAMAGDNHNNTSSNPGYDNSSQGGYGNTTSPTHHGDTGYGNSQNTSSGYGNSQNTPGGYDNGPLNSHSDGGKYHAPKGTAIGQSSNTTHVGPHQSGVANVLDPRVDSDQPKMNRNTQQGYGEPGYDNRRSGHGNDQPGYGNDQSDYGNDQSGYGTTTTTTTNTSTSVGHGDYGTTHGNIPDSNKRLPEDPAHPKLGERLNKDVDTSRSTRNEYENTGYGNTTGSGQYGTSTHDSSKRVPEVPTHPSMKEKMDPRYATESSHKDHAYGGAAYGSNSGPDQYGTTTHDPNKRLPEDPAHPTVGERLDKNVDTSRSTRNEYENAGYGNTSSGMDSRRHGHNDEYAAGAAGAYGATESSRHHAKPVHNDDSIMNRGHPTTSMHPNDKRYDSSRTNHETGPDGEYLPGPAPNTAGPHKSDMLNKLDPRVDSDQSKLEKEREREGYGSVGTSGPHYGNDHERRLNEGRHERHHEGTGATSGLGHTERHGDPYSSNSPTANRDSGYGGQGSTISNVPHRRPVNETGSYGNDQYGRGNDYDRSNPAGTYNNPATTNQSSYGNDQDENDFECAKCGHKNTHLRKNKTNQYGEKPTLKERLDPRVDATGDGQAGFMK